ncbi:MAG TPA: ethanolamine ammonia-lyase reactivating factor EutA [Xanthobacteraceae bacterium]|nr:ethanolamine ammonia-lyase reactivating factor EutA [Xanthobacteraceae bacterium]
MHDLEFDHQHMQAAEESNEVAWASDNVELTTIGIDIGSSTSHLMFARVHLHRLSPAMSSRFVVVYRKVLWQSPIALTPYLPDYTIDVDELAGFIGGCYAYAGIEPGDIDSGAVILTGEAIKRRNARAIAELFSEEAGRFVCASAGHHLECQLAAHGSGAVALSRGHNARILNVDIGGGTTKLALIDNGRITATAAIAVGGRLLVEDAKAGLTRIEEPARAISESLGIALSPGQALPPADRERIVERMVRLIMRMIDRRPADALPTRLLVTEPWAPGLANAALDALTFSGGVAEYLYKREKRQFGDLGLDLAHALAHMLARRRDLPPVWDPGQGIRATVIGAAQFSVQVSGNTIAITRGDELPLQNLPVLAPAFELGERIDPTSVAAACRAALTQADIEEGVDAVAFAITWHGDPLHARLHALAAGICAAVPATIASGYPLVLLIDGDVGMSLGRIIRNEIAPAANVIAIDGVQLRQFDYIDIGRMIEVTNVVPVVIKSLLFK